jgi:uncharacterized protein (DUF2267 family)
MSGAVGNLLGSAGPEAPPSRPPPGPSIADTRSTRAPAERQTLEENVGQPEPMAASMAARLQGQPISYKEFISAVQEAGALETAGEAAAAAKAALGELGGCLSWPQAQNLAAWLPKPLRQVVSLRSFESSMSRFAPQALVKMVAEQERVGLKRAARDTRAVLLTLDQTLPKFLAEQLHSELASLWAPLTRPSAASAAQDSL